MQPRIADVPGAALDILRRARAIFFTSLHTASKTPNNNKKGKAGRGWISYAEKRKLSLRAQLSTLLAISRMYCFPVELSLASFLNRSIFFTAVGVLYHVVLHSLHPAHGKKKSRNLPHAMPWLFFCAGPHLSDGVCVEVDPRFSHHHLRANLHNHAFDVVRWCPPLPEPAAWKAGRRGRKKKGKEGGGRVRRNGYVEGHSWSAAKTNRTASTG